ILAGQSRTCFWLREVAAPFRDLCLVRRHLGVSERQRIGLRIVAVRFQKLLDISRYSVAVSIAWIAPVGSLSRQQIRGVAGESVQICRRKVWSQIGAVAPDRAVLHQRILEEDLLTGNDVGSRKDRCTRAIYNFPRNRRSVRVGSSGQPN